MPRVMIITPKHIWGNSYKIAVEQILFIQQLLEKVDQVITRLL